MTLRPEQSHQASFLIRQAREEDLDQAARIKAAGDARMNLRLHPLLSPGSSDEEAGVNASRANLAILQHEQPEQVWVAADGSRVVGVSSAAFRGRTAHVQSFFVAPDEQQRGIGRRLLDALVAAGRAGGCASFSLQSSDDPRAIALYLSRGFCPGPPNVVWAAASPQARFSELASPFEASPIGRDDPATMNTVGDIDKAVRGATRPGDLERWLDDGVAGSLLKDRESGTPVGYFLIGTRNGHLRIGPVAAIDEAAFPDVLSAAFAAAVRVGTEASWSMAIPGENRRSVATLQAAGFRPLFLIPYFSTAPFGQFDRYAFHDLDFL